MQKTNGINKEEGQIYSVFDETINALNFRAHFFPINHMSNEVELLQKEPNPQVKSLSRIIPGLSVYSIAESPLQPQLRDLYTAQHKSVDSPRCILPHPSDGEKSINGDEDNQPTFKWLTSTIVDSTKLELDQIKPMKVERGKIPQQWTNIVELLIFNIDKKIYIKENCKSLESYLYSMFSKFPWVRVKKIKIIYFKGKPSAILKFSDSAGCVFAYYNLIISNQIQRKQQLGQNSQIYRIISNRTKLQQDNTWVGILFRRLPGNLSRENFLSALKKSHLNPIWVEELVQIQNFKYTLCTVSCLQEAFRFCQIFQVNTPFKDVKVNLHPKSKKIWSPPEHT